MNLVTKATQLTLAALAELAGVESSQKIFESNMVLLSGTVISTAIVIVLYHKRRR